MGYTPGTIQDKILFYTAYTGQLFCRRTLDTSKLGVNLS